MSRAQAKKEQPEQAEEPEQAEQAGEAPAEEPEVVEPQDAPSDDGGDGDGGEDGASEVDKLRDQLARARADYDNLQKRVARDAALERERVKARFLEDFLRVFEYSQMAVHEADRNPGPLSEGVKMVHREFERVLESEGLRPFGAIGDPFDATLHDVAEVVEVDHVDPGHVSKVIKPGYKLGERILRHARVAVAADEEE